MEIKEEIAVEVKKKRGRIFLKAGKIILVSIIGFTGLLLLLTWIFEDKIKQYAVERLNRNLTAPVKVEEINLSFFAKFPYGSLEFTNVLIEDPDSIGRPKDTLIAAEKIFLEFSIWDILSGDYQVKNIEATNAYVNLFTDKKGSHNYTIWKESNDTSETHFDFNLKEILFTRTRFNYSNYQSRQDYSFFIDDLKMNGRFTEKQFDLGIKTNCMINTVRNRNVSLLKNKKAVADFDLNIDKEKKIYSVKKGDFKIGDLNFLLSGAVSEMEKGNDCNLEIKGNRISIHSLLTTFPWIMGDDISAYETSGDLEFESTVTGLAGGGNIPDIKAAFKIADGNLSEKESGITLRNLSFDGSFNNKNEKKVAELILKNISGVFNEGNFSGDLSMTNFDKPFVKAKLSGNFSLEALQKFFRFNEVEKASGGLVIKAGLEADFSFIEKNEEWNMKIRKSSGKAELKKVNLKFREQYIPYNDFNGTITLKDDHATVENLEGYLGKTDIRLNGILNNLVPFLLLDNKKLNIVADLYTKKADLDDMLGGGTKTDTSTSRLRFPSDINFNLDTHIDELVLGTFIAKKISGNFKLIDQQFTGKNLSMNFAGGECSGDLEIDGRSEDLFGLNSSFTITHMKISDLFASFENFGQKEILPENIRGRISSDIRFGAVMDSRLYLDQEKITARASVKITDGELISLKPLTGISGFLKTDKLSKVFLRRHLDDIENRLDHVKFAELSNELTIRNGKIYIPRMDIKSSALDIRMSGEHGFNDSILYEFDFRFRDLKMDESETEYGTIIDDGTGLRIYIKMSGTIDNPIYSSDAQRRKEDRKEYNRNEVLNTKAILQNEFGLFKKDSTLKIKETPKEDVKFLMEWDEEETKEPKPGTPPDKKEEYNKKRMEKLKNKLGIEDNQKQEFKIEE